MTDGNVTKSDPDDNGELAEETVSSTNRISEVDVFDDADEFSLESLRSDQGYDDPLAETVQSEIANGRPSKDLFVRSHPDVNKYWIQVWMLDLDGHPTLSGKYIIAKSILNEVRSRYHDNVKRKLIVPFVDEYKVLAVWPLSVHNPESGRINSWTASARKVMKEALTTWVRVVSSQTAHEYRFIPALHDLGDPAFPDMPMQEIFNQAFEQYKITAMDHPVLKALSGSRA
jgi:hypothetical protein